MIQQSVIIVGAGVFGVTAGIELNRRGFAVTIIARGNLPHPDASSTDISKMIRMDYGRDDFYMQLMEQALEGWDKWNQEWDEPLYHEDGFLMMKRRPIQAGDFEYESLQHLQKRGHGNNIDKMTSQSLAEKYPMWKAENYPDGYVNRRAGWAESGRVLAQLISIAQAEGVKFQTEAGFQQLMENHSQVIGIITEDGKKHHANFVVIAAGAWTSVLFPELQNVMWATGQPVIHFRPENPEAFTPPNFIPWAADIEQSGWYGFAYHPHEKVVKIANHGVGIASNPNEPPAVSKDIQDTFREFLRFTFPALASAPIIQTRVCFYCDTWDGDFWIDHDPNRKGLIFATGGSGHGFKFAPILGELIADALQKKNNPNLARFRWRERGSQNTEHSRYSGDS